MTEQISRRAFATLGAGLVWGTAMTAEGAATNTGPIEMPFSRDYPLPGFKPAWKKQQINRQLVQDFVIYAHGDLAMTEKLLVKEHALLNATMDWGGGDWETGL